MPPVEQWEIVARESIRDLVARYNANGDSGRFDAVVELFADDAEMELDTGSFRGRDEIRAMFTSTRDDLAARDLPKQLRHHTSTLQIDVHSETAASSRCYFQVLMAHGLDHWGRYLDEFRVADGRWRFARRRVVVDGAAAGGWVAARQATRD
jgi:ketosteroid isomerase-like protein